MTRAQRGADEFLDTELFAFLQGTADPEIVDRITMALDTRPELAERLQSLDPGLPMVRNAMDRLLQDAPSAGLARALAEASVSHATRGLGIGAAGGASSGNHAGLTAAASGAWSSIRWFAVALGLGLAFVGGLYAGGWRFSELGFTVGETSFGSKKDDRLRRSIPVPDRAMPDAPVVPAGPVPGTPAPVDESPVAEPQPELGATPTAPAAPAVTSAAPDTTAPDTTVAAGPSVATEASPPIAPAPTLPSTAQPTVEAPVAATSPAPSPTAAAPTGPPSATTAWVQAVAGYVRLMTSETLEQTGQSRAEIRARLATMSRRFGIDLRAVERSVADLALKRVEILQLNGRPLLQLGFTDGDGTPLAVCIILRAVPAAAKGLPEPTTFRSEDAVGLTAVHWDRQPLGLLVIGRGPTSSMFDAAQRIDRAVRPL